MFVVMFSMRSLLLDFHKRLVTRSLVASRQLLIDRAITTAFLYFDIPFNTYCYLTKDFNGLMTGVRTWRLQYTTINVVLSC